MQHWENFDLEILVDGASTDPKTYKTPRARNAAADYLCKDLANTDCRKNAAGNQIKDTITDIMARTSDANAECSSADATKCIKAVAAGN